MRSFKLALATLVLTASFGAAVAANAGEKVAKPAPGKCGVGMFYDVKTKKCVAK